MQLGIQVSGLAIVYLKSVPNSPRDFERSRRHEVVAKVSYGLKYLDLS
jgi:hypothetical protein